MSTAAEIASALNGRSSGGGWTACCPAHSDTNPSLAIDEGSNGKVLLHCRAGCSQDAVIDAVRRLGLEPDGKPGSRVRQRLPARRTVATYDYRDESGQLAYQVVRWKRKEFRQRRPDGRGGWIASIEGVKRLPYRLPEVLAHPDRHVYIAEGEKDADRLARQGLIATTNSGGAGSGNAWPYLAKWFQGRRVTILPDNDEAGRRHAEVVARALNGIAASIKIVALPDLPEKGDVSDWLDAGHAIRELRQLARAAPVRTPETQAGGDSDRDANAAQAEGDSDRDAEAEAEIARLAALPPVAYDRERQGAAERLGCRLPTLDKEVEAKRAELRIETGAGDDSRGRPVELRDTVPIRRR